jgi:hypothetical protein
MPVTRIRASSQSTKVVTLTSSSNLTACNADTTDIGIITLTENTTFSNPTGTPFDGQLLLYRIVSASSFTIAFDTDFEPASSLSYPLATTGGNKLDEIAARWSATRSKWIYDATTIGAIASGLRTAVVTVDFTSPSKGTFFNVSVASALSGDRIVPTPSLVMPSGVDEDELECDPIVAYGSCTSNGTVRLFIGSVDGSFIYGQRNINLVIG